MVGLLGKKQGMSQVFRSDGTCVPVTSIAAGPCVVVQVKTAEKEGYRSVQLGFVPQKERRVSKPRAGHFKRANVAPQRLLREFRFDAADTYAVGQSIDVALFQEGDFVDVVGVSIGKGFQGGMKRFGWSGGPDSHGSMSHRRIGSMGTNTTPGRVLRGHHLAGHMGNRRITVQNLEVVKVDKETNTLVVKGAVPGCKGSYLMVRKAKKK
ncbi:MAG: 50S ribosomal protein L3 [Candidatus Omnitrophica bacterium]|nr:50S ribosomal protein L3 [Candidatus Omnitrophota bacterium]